VTDFSRPRLSGGRELEAWVHFLNACRENSTGIYSHRCSQSGRSYY
jgi:hypothetical protein